MKPPAHLRMSDLHGFRRLATDAVVGLADLVEAMHHTITQTPGVFGNAPKGKTTGITGFVYKTVRGVTRFVGGGLDALLGTLAPLLAERRSSSEREAVLAVLNGVLGDYLEASGNPLAIPMQWRRDGHPLKVTKEALAAAFPEAGGKVVVLLHGLCMNDLQWQRDGQDHGAALARDAGYTPLYLHYNTGRHVSTNGRDLSDRMQTLVDAWPVPIEELAIVGHSMGGLVARSAIHCAALARQKWTRCLSSLVFLGTPHHGAPMERAGAIADYLIEISPYTAPLARLGKVRSAGIKDLRYGYVQDEDWARPLPTGTHARRHALPLPLPADVRCFAIAASKQARPASPRARLRGDGLVPVASALGQHRDPALALAIPDDHRFVAYETGHFDLLEAPEVYERLARWLTARRPPRP